MSVVSADRQNENISVSLIYQLVQLLNVPIVTDILFPDRPTHSTSALEDMAGGLLL